MLAASERLAGKGWAEEDAAKKATRISLRDGLEGDEARIWDQIAAKLRPFIIEELKDDMLDEAWDTVRKDLRSSVKWGLKETLEEEVLKDLRKEIQAKYGGPAAEGEDSEKEEEQQQLGDEPVSAVEACHEEAAASRPARAAAVGKDAAWDMEEEETRARLFWDVREELRRELKSESWTQLCSELAPEVADELEEELRGEAVAELRHELEDEVRRDLGSAAG